MLEVFDDLWDNFVDPADELYDVDGPRWDRARAARPLAGATTGVAFANEQQLAEIRLQCRVLAATNEFAINGHENRISYIVGSGHTYRRAPATAGWRRRNCLAEVQAVLDEFVRLNKWHKRQQEIVRRKDRDGECFLRFFAAADGTTRVRFVEPGQVATPPDAPTIRPPPWASKPTRATWKPCWAIGSTAGWSPPPKSSIARPTSTPT